MPRAADLAYATVREDILGGRHAVGARLREEELALALGVSRTPVREALRRLDAEGLVEVLPHRGALVARWDDADLDEIFALRALLEGYGARQAAGRADAALLDRLDALCAGMDAAAAAGDLERVSTQNLDFHAAVLAAAGNRRLGTLLAAVVHVPLVQRTFSGYSPDALARSLGHHKELVAALRARDGAWAEAVMRAHVHAARSSLTPTRHGAA